MMGSTGLHYTVSVASLAVDTFSLYSFTLEEALSEPFTLELNLFSNRSDIEAADIIDQPLVLKIWQDGELQRVVHATAFELEIKETGFRRTSYQIIAHPSVQRMAWLQNARIFQAKTVEQIVSQLLEEAGVPDFVFSLKRELQEREYCVQYTESNLMFVQRILAEEGITYYFEHSDDKHTIVFVDDSQSHPSLEDERAIPFNASAGGLGEIDPLSGSRQPWINEFSSRVRTAASSVTMRDRFFRNPQYNYQHQSQARALNGQQRYEHYQYPGRYKEGDSGRAFTEHRLAYLRRDTQVGAGKSNQPTLQMGYFFALGGHTNTDFNKAWLVTTITHQGVQAQALEEEAGEGATTYSNSFSSVPAGHQWRPEPMPKPQIFGPQIATVTGPAGEEIYVDEYSRVKVQFPWDRYGNEDDFSSCFVRVSQEWAGVNGTYGAIAIPRIGTEVIVSFLEGDMDQPIITGRTYNAKNMPPNVLAANKTKTTFKTKSHKSAGYNELTFDDATDNELIYRHAQKNEDIQINNDKTQNIGHDESHSVAHNRTRYVGNDESITVEQDVRYHVNRDQFETIEKDLTTTVNNSWVESVHFKHIQNVGENKKLNVDGQYQIEVLGGISSNTSKHQIMGSDKVVITGGNSRITLAKGSITLESAKINLVGSVSIGGSGSASVPALSGSPATGLPVSEECPLKE
ncbi:MAG: type VI secretion system Vgr family protein [Pseudomonadales bacterium]